MSGKNADTQSSGELNTEHKQKENDDGKSSTDENSKQEIKAESKSLAPDSVTQEEKTSYISLLEDNIKPAEEHKFKWKVTESSRCWRLLLNGNTSSLVKHSSVTSELETEKLNELLFGVIEGGKGIELVNTIQKVFIEGQAVRYDAIVYALAVCTCSDKLDVKKKAYNLLNDVCANSSRFLQFIGYHEKICKAMRDTTGWSRRHRKAVQDWYHQKPPLEMAKVITQCARHNHWTHKDVMRLAHIVPVNEDFKVLSSYIVRGLKNTVDDFETETDKPGEDQDRQKVLHYLEKVTLVRRSKDIETLIPIIKELKLSWDFIPCHLHDDVELWKGLFSYFPLGVLIPQVCRIAKLRLFHHASQEKEIFLRKCRDPEEVKASSFHPYSILMYRELYNNAINDPKRKISWEVDPDILSGLNQAFELSIANLHPTGKRYFITIDASNSMKAHILNNNHIRCRVAAACMALCIARTEKKTVVKAFSKELTEIKIDQETKLEDIVKCLEETPLGGTDCSRPMIFAKGKKLKTDVFIVFTDKETWKGKTTPFEALRQYRKAVKIPAKLVVVALDTEGTSEKLFVANPEDRGMMDVFGFSPSIPKIIHNFSSYDF